MYYMQSNGSLKLMHIYILHIHSRSRFGHSVVVICLSIYLSIYICIYTHTCVCISQHVSGHQRLSAPQWTSVVRKFHLKNPALCWSSERKWFLVGGLRNMAGWFFHSVGNVIIPTDFHSIISQRGRLKPPIRFAIVGTRLQNAEGETPRSTSSRRVEAVNLWGCHFAIATEDSTITQQFKDIRFIWLIYDWYND